MSYAKLNRSKTDRVLGGVASGIAEYFAIDPLLIRLAFVLLTLFSGTGVIIYIVCWFLIPEEGDTMPTKDRAKKVGEEIESKVEEIAAKVESRVDGKSDKDNGTNIAGLVLVGLGILFLLQNLTGFDIWRNFWPIVLIIVGVSVMLRTGRRKE